MSAPVAVDPELGAESMIAERLRREWRMLEEVSLRRRPEGDGYEATIRLNSNLVRAAAEQQGTEHSAELRVRVEARRLRVIAHCVERVNAGLSADEAIQDFQVVGVHA